MSSSQAWSRALVFAACLTAFTASFAGAQVIPTGITQWSTQIVAGPVAIDMATGGMSVSISVRDKTGAIPLKFELINNSGNEGGVNNYQSFLGGISGGMNFATPTPTLCGTYPNESDSYGTGLPGQWVLDDATGAKHPFTILQHIIVGPGTGCGGTWGPVTTVADDGSGYTAVVDLTGCFCTSGSEREFTLEGSWYADEEIQAGADRDVAAAG